ncbi:MAG: thioredoxin-disulfide reductase [Ruminococcaceae bacterium]|nr:thioredoxin-disulfide reductase [Oscillospiraceae bacterium]
MEHIYDVIILGGGPAGYTAALYSARAGLDTLVVEKYSVGGQMALTDVIENYPGFDEGIEGFALGMKMQAGAERFGAVTEYGEVIKTELAGEIKRVITDSKELLARSVIIATGANPRELGVEGERALVGNGVHYCAHCDGRFYKDKTVVLVGGGNSAAADALYLSRLVKKVYVVHRRDTLRATKIYHEPLMKAKNVEFLWNSALDAYIVDGKLTGARIKNLSDGSVREVEADGVFVSIGRTPATELFKGEIELDERGYIIADETTKTNLSGVFAAGDVRTKELRQVVTAVADGAVAADNVEKYLSEK